MEAPASFSRSSAPKPTPRACKGRGVRISAEGGIAMFETQPQAEVEALIKTDPEFKQLYQLHRDLDKKVTDAVLGVLPIDDTRLGQMKRQKLRAKERLLRIYDAKPH
jgi:uncharacterized protein